MGSLQLLPLCSPWALGWGGEVWGCCMGAETAPLPSLDPCYFSGWALSAPKCWSQLAARAAPHAGLAGAWPRPPQRARPARTDPPGATQLRGELLWQQPGACGLGSGQGCLLCSKAALPWARATWLLRQHGQSLHARGRAVLTSSLREPGHGEAATAGLAGLQPVPWGSPTALSLRLQGCVQGRVLWEGGGTQLPYAAPEQRPPAAGSPWAAALVNVKANRRQRRALPPPRSPSARGCFAFLPRAGPARPPQLKKAAGLARARRASSALGPCTPPGPRARSGGALGCISPPVPGSGQARLLEVAAAACPAWPVRPASRAGSAHPAGFSLCRESRSAQPRAELAAGALPGPAMREPRPLPAEGTGTPLRRQSRTEARGQLCAGGAPAEGGPCQHCPPALAR